MTNRSYDQCRGTAKAVDVAALVAVSAPVQAPATKLNMASATDTFLTPMRRYNGEPGSPVPKLGIPTTLEFSA